ncbi:MAG: CRISPR system precrRNA processing endoribonuclease RAMP protein Cas6 [Nitrospirae bacterium]|nr:CRISPR system precrRNA processing endoribonuclease RAMP protein Cas6 [Nitrospirota bacterium]
MKTINNLAVGNKTVTSYLDGSLSGFTTMTLKFVLIPFEKIYLGPDEKKGDIWRGGFGEALKNLACFYRWEPTDCMNCDKTQSCFYYAYFESDKPHPYVIAPALDSKEVYGKGDEIHLDIVLIGEAIRHADKFVKTMEELGRRGIGRKRVRFYIKDVAAGNAVNFEGISNKEPESPCHFLIEFLTPVKIKEKDEGIYYNNLSFQTLFKVLIKRIINLNNLYCNGIGFDKEMIENGKQYLLRLAESIEIETFTEWKDYKRFSSRQDKSMKIGGQLGIIKLQGDLTPFYPYLKIGEFIGVGQNTTSGFGRYRLLPSEKFKSNV